MRDASWGFKGASREMHLATKLGNLRVWGLGFSVQGSGFGV